MPSPLLALVLLTAAAHHSADLHATIARIVDESATALPDKWVRDKAALEKMGAAAEPDLLAALTIDDGNVRFFVCSVLATVGSVGALPQLASLFEDSYPPVRSACGSAYGLIATRTGGSDLAPLRRLLGNDPVCYVRCNVARDAGAIDSAELRAFWMALLGTKLECETEVALSGLGAVKTGRDEAGAVILPFLEDGNDVSVREAAALALGTLGYAPAAPLLRRIIAGADPGMNIQTFCIDALGEVGNADDIPLLKATIAADPYHGEGVHALRGRAAIRKIKARR